MFEVGLKGWVGEREGIPGNEIKMNRSVAEAWQVEGKRGIGRGTEQRETRLQGCLASS